MHIIVLIALVIGLGLTPEPVHAIDAFLVDSNADSSDANVGNGICADVAGLCSLRAAIQEINASGVTSKIIITKMTDDTIRISSPLIITRSMTIEGQARTISKITHNGNISTPEVSNGFITTANLTLDKVNIDKFFYAVVVDTPGILVKVNNSLIGNSKIGLRLTKASTVEIFQSRVEFNTVHGIYVSDKGYVRLIDSQVRGNTSEFCGAGVSVIGTGSKLNSSNNTLIVDNQSISDGGAICNSSGQIILLDTNLSENISSKNGGGLYQNQGFTYIDGSSTVGNNQASFGGGIYIMNGGLSIRSVGVSTPRVIGNNAVNAGGGLYLGGIGPHLLDGVIVEGNKSKGSGGILLYHPDSMGSKLTIRNSSIVNNQATEKGGGGVSINYKTNVLFIENTTISGNTAVTDGGGLFIVKGYVDISNTTISNNTCNSDLNGDDKGGGISLGSEYSIYIRNSIVAGNKDLKDTSQPNLLYSPDIYGYVNNSAGYNIFGVCNFYNSSCQFGGYLTGNQINVPTEKLGLSALQNDETSTRVDHWVHLLLPTSVAVNAGNPTGCKDYTSNSITQDQLDRDRIINGRCDAGAVESSFDARPVSIADLSVNQYTPLGGTNFTGTVEIDLPAPAGGTVVNLSSNNTDILTLPSSITIPQGSSFANFQIETTEVSNNSTVKITANLGFTTKTTSVTVLPGDQTSPVLLSVVVSPGSVLGGESLTGTVNLNIPSPSSVTSVSLRSSSPDLVIVPDNVTVPIGSTSANFSIQTTNVMIDTQVIIVATLDTTTKDTSLTLLSEEQTIPLLLSVIVSPVNVLGGESLIGTVSLNIPSQTSETNVSLYSTVPDLVIVPDNVIVPIGNTSTDFSIQTTNVTIDTEVRIVAILNTTIKDSFVFIKPAKLVFLPLLTK